MYSEGPGDLVSRLIMGIIRATIWVMGIMKLLTKSPDPPSRLWGFYLRLRKLLLDRVSGCSVEGVGFQIQGSRLGVQGGGKGMVSSDLRDALIMPNACRPAAFAIAIPAHFSVLIC